MQLQLLDGSTLRCNYCVLCIGSGYFSPVKAQESQGQVRWVTLHARPPKHRHRCLAKLLQCHTREDLPTCCPAPPVVQEAVLNSRLDALHAAAATLEAARSVVVVGGGYVGVELAAEVAGHYGRGKRAKAVVLISSSAT